MADEPLRSLVAAGLQITAVHGREDTKGIPPSVLEAMEQEKAAKLPIADPMRGADHVPLKFCGACGSLLDGTRPHCPTCFPEK